MSAHLRVAMYSRSGASGPSPSSDAERISDESENFKTDDFPLSVINEYLPQLSIFSALSRRKHSPEPPNLAKADTGVSVSASSSAYTGTTFAPRASSMNSDFEGVILKAKKKRPDKRPPKV